MRISDWSSDVCASDLTLTMTNSVVGGIRNFGGTAVMQGTNALTLGGGNDWAYGGVGSRVLNLAPDSILNLANQSRLGLNVRGGSAIKGERARSEERRVGKECVDTCSTRRSPSP